MLQVRQPWCIKRKLCLEAGFSVGKDALAYEKSDSEAAKTYVNIIAVKEGNEDMKDSGTCRCTEI